MAQTNCTTLILAAGKGTRMKSRKPKVLHEIAGLALIGHVLNAARAAGTGAVVVVVGPDMNAATLKALDADAVVAVQKKPLGTADAVKTGLAAAHDKASEILVVFGDTPLISGQTLEMLRDRVRRDADIALLGFHAEDPAGYGRLICGHDGAVLAIREEADASEAERAITLCNSGVMAFKAETLRRCLEEIDADNAKGEYYLTDAVAIARAGGAAISFLACAEDEVRGINTQAQLAACEQIMQNRLRRDAMDQGVTFHDPATVYLACDTSFGADVVIEPHVIFGPGVAVGERVTIKGFSHIEAAKIASGATIGPFARLRPGADIGRDAKIGNFVEIKQARIEQGAKINHLTYIGDARIGAGANIGAGTITCNYDGYAKHFTDIGAGAFIGSNAALIAPVKIGKGAYVGSGSVISGNVEAGALALTRAQVTQKPGWADKFRKANEKRKK